MPPIAPLPPLILASTSPYRRALLDRLGLHFAVESPGIAEAYVPGESPGARAERLSRAKALAVAHRHPQAVVIGSDQVAASAEHVLDKPGDAATCRAQLAALSHSTAHFFTGCAIISVGTGLDLKYLDTTAVVFRSLSSAEIDRYVTREQPFDSAGAFKVEALGITLCERIDSGDPTALIGLPLIWLASALREVGYPLP
jgi:septum formation protein